MNWYRYVTNAGLIGTLLFLILGTLGMTGCTLEGDTYSGTVVKVDCGAATSGGGIQSCGTGSPHDENWTDNRTYE